DQAQQDVLRADVGVAQRARLVKGQLQDALGSRGEADLALRGAVPAADHLLHLGPDLLQADVQVLQRPGGDALPLGREAQEDVLCPDHVMPEAPRLFLRENHHFLRPLRKPPEHRVSPSLGENLSSRLRAARAAQPPSFSARRSRSRMRAARFSSRAGASSSWPISFCRWAGRIITISSCRILGSIPFTMPRSMPRRTSDRSCIASWVARSRALARMPYER